MTVQARAASMRPSSRCRAILAAAASSAAAAALSSFPTLSHGWVPPPGVVPPPVVVGRRVSRTMPMTARPRPRCGGRRFSSPRPSRPSGEEEEAAASASTNRPCEDEISRRWIVPEPRGGGATRRSFFDCAGRTTASAASVAFASSSVVVVVVSPPSAASASTGRAKGAAEYDLEYYLRNIAKKNAREGPVSASSRPAAPPPRKLRGDLLLPLLLDDSFSSRCVPCRVLSEVSGRSPEVVSDMAEGYRSKSRQSFAARAKWIEESVSDEYYFDLSCYALWRTAADLIPDYKKRDAFARSVGRGIYREAESAGLLRGVEDAATDGGTKPNGPLTGTIPAVQEILNLFDDTEFCSSYRIGEKGDGESRSGLSVLDEFDDDDFSSGLSVNCLISVFRPANLGSSLQITGEGSRFGPDFVGSTIAALWEERGAEVSYETYFVDPEYRPNPKDYFPDEQLLQFTLTKKKQDNKK